MTRTATTDCRPRKTAIDFSDEFDSEFGFDGDAYTSDVAQALWSAPRCPSWMARHDDRFGALRTGDC